MYPTGCWKVTVFSRKSMVHRVPEPRTVHEILARQPTKLFCWIFLTQLDAPCGFHTSGKQPLPHPLPPLSSASQSGEDLAHEALVKTMLDDFVLSKVWHLGQTKNGSGGLPCGVTVLWRCSITFFDCKFASQKCLPLVKFRPDVKFSAMAVCQRGPGMGPWRSGYLSSSTGRKI